MLDSTLVFRSFIELGRYLVEKQGRILNFPKHNVRQNKREMDKNYTDRFMRSNSSKAFS